MPTPPEPQASPPGAARFRFSTRGLLITMTAVALATVVVFVAPPWIAVTVIATAEQGVRAVLIAGVFCGDRRTKLFCVAALAPLLLGGEAFGDLRTMRWPIPLMPHSHQSRLAFGLLAQLVIAAFTGFLALRVGRLWDDGLTSNRPIK
ncbi:hypothetical protein Mal64_00300 [Pseudobythopirellula maris]|uniref:Uncharacterized protein n=1 Tax=Pseudobythopirellula maris TaxID=2527991 RepID=A0A5C5ZSB3_9BACT|nr:hypothetical protein [Pseudobythopirellula maris]TWT89651.1 hypothetical protein Mal64_00300 [Pseudobythopirellula maris]